MSLQARASQYAQQYGLDPELYLRLIQQESGWDPGAVSPQGAAGLTQVMPDTARDPGYGVAPLKPGSVDDQLRFGAEYLSKMQSHYGGDTERALAAYNWGPGNADKWSGNRADLPAETQTYLANVLPGGETSQAGLDASRRPPSAGAGLTDDTHATTQAVMRGDLPSTPPFFPTGDGPGQTAAMGGLAAEYPAAALGGLIGMLLNNKQSDEGEEETRPAVPLHKRLAEGETAPEGMLRLPGTQHALNQRGLGAALMSFGGVL